MGYDQISWKSEARSWKQLLPFKLQTSSYIKMNNNFGFKDLLVWQKAMNFADTVIELTEDLNTNGKHFRLIEQIESAVASVPQNIAEGKGRRTNKEFIQFLYFSRGSLYEVITLLNLFEKRNWIDKEKLQESENMAFEIASMIKGLINSLKQ